MVGHIQRHGIAYQKTNGKLESASNSGVSVWQSEILPRLVSKYEPRNIFNADEFGLFFKLMPDKSFVFKGEKCHVGKLSKVRVTVLVGANSDSSRKSSLLMIGKSAKPRSFKNVKKLPCVYKNLACA